MGLPHHRWGERPLLLVVLEPDAEFERDEIMEAIKPHVASWCLPDAIVAIEEIPHTGTGKIDKKVLRERFSKFDWPE